MSAEFSDSGISFQYPDDWRLEREELSNGWSVTVQSPGTAFFLLCLREDNPDSSDLAEQALDDMAEVYPDLESELGMSRIAGRNATGHDIRFFSFDLTNSCWTRSFNTPAGTILVMTQVNDLEMSDFEPDLRRICASVRVEE